jgi:hypothetical protein
MKSQAGMGMIELVVGIGLLAVCIMGLNALVLSFIGGNLNARLIDVATRLAEARVHELRSTPFDQVKIGTTTDLWRPTAGSVRQSFVRTTRVEAGALTSTRNVTVTVRWSERGRRDVALVSELAR